MDDGFTAVHGIQQRIPHKSDIGKDRHDLISAIVFPVCPEHSWKEFRDDEHLRVHSGSNDQCGFPGFLLSFFTKPRVVGYTCKGLLMEMRCRAAECEEI